MLSSCGAAFSGLRHGHAERVVVAWSMDSAACNDASLTIHVAWPVTSMHFCTEASLDNSPFIYFTTLHPKFDSERYVLPQQFTMPSATSTVHAQAVSHTLTNTTNAGVC